jgi:hypothetical protein
MGNMELSREFVEKLSEIFFKEEFDDDFINLKKPDKF